MAEPDLAGSLESSLIRKHAGHRVTAPDGTRGSVIHGPNYFGDLKVQWDDGAELWARADLLTWDQDGDTT